MIGAGTVINPIIKVITSVAILAALGIFIVKPILETTEATVATVSDHVRSAQQASEDASEDASRDAELVTALSRAQSFIASLASSWPAAARETRECLQQAARELSEVKACESFAERLVFRVQSDRTFSLSYADTLEAQGDGDGAQRLRDCVEEAGFATAAMQRCRDLADELLFG